jgi:hypothetical protein
VVEIGGAMVCVIAAGDNHEPFSRDGYFEFIRDTYRRYGGEYFVHTGDAMDFHSTSFHTKEADAHGAKEEYYKAVEGVRRYYQAFPRGCMVSSNHDTRPHRIAHSVGLIDEWLAEDRKILQLPDKWEYGDKFVIDGVLYSHGEGYTGYNAARNKCKDEMRSCVIGHIHAHAGIAYYANSCTLVWGMNVGSGIDNSSYAARYGKNFRHKPIAACGVIVDGRPHLEIMPLGNKIQITVPELRRHGKLW